MRYIISAEKTIFTLGGARSIDKAYREENISWWPQEMITKKDIDNACRNLDKVDYKVDYLLTHCTDTTGIKLLNYHFKSDAATDFIYKLKYIYNLEYKQHFFE